MPYVSAGASVVNDLIHAIVRVNGSLLILVPRNMGTASWVINNPKTTVIMNNFKS